MNQKKLKSAIAKMVKSVMGPRKVEVGEFTRTDGVDLTSFNLDELGDPNNTDLSDNGPLWDRTTVLPENGLVDLYLYTHGPHGELDTNLLVRIVDAKVVQIFENSESPRNEIPLVFRHPQTLEPFTVRGAREFLGISEEDVPPVRTFRALTHQATSPQAVTILPHVFYDYSREDVPTFDKFNRMQGKDVQVHDQVHILQTGWVKLTEEVS